MFRPTDITLPEPGSLTARRVFSEALRRLLRDLAEVPAALPKSATIEARALSALVKHAAKESAGPLFSALRRPTVSALVRCLRPSSTLGETSRDALAVELLATLQHDLRAAGCTVPSAPQTRTPPRILSLLERTAIQPKTSAVTFPYHLIERDLVLALADNNPLAMEEAHPEKQGNAIDLGGQPASAWLTALREALALIREILPELAGEMDLFVQQIVPVGYDEHIHLSASYQEAIGTLYMTLHPSLMTMAEALIHEFSHNKINALFELDDLLTNAWSPLYTSPVRPDPRPLHGILLAVHAFLPVARLYEKMIEAGHPRAKNEDFQRRFAQIRATNREGCAVVLANAKPTAMGQSVFEEIARWDAHFANGYPTT